MTEPDEIAPLLPWYANRTLGAEDSRRVEEHLPGCEDCRAALRHLADYQTLCRERRAGALTEHVQARLLVEYEEGSAALEPETVAWIETHLDTCTVCADASRVLRELAVHEHGAAPSKSTPASGAWTFLGRTLLAPAPALAYLLLLLLAVPAYLMRAPAPQKAAASLPAAIAPAIHLYPELAFRGTPDGSGKSEPIEIPHAPGSPILLVVHTDLDPEELEDPARRLRLDILDGATTVWSAERSAAELAEGAVLPVLLFPDLLALGRTYRIELRSQNELLLERSFVLVGAGEGER